MENSITKAFNNKDFGWLEVIEIDGKTYFPATDCAEMLGYTNPQKAIKDHCNPPGVTFRSVGVQTGVKADGSPAIQKVEKKYIDEGNLYRLITHSKLPTAERFERWVFDEVLPEIRQSGRYGIKQSVNEAALAEIIVQAVTTAVTETIKQMIPLMKFEQLEYEDNEISVKRQRRRTAGIIEKLPRAMRDRVDEMLLGTTSYREIQAYLRLNGVNISESSIHRYAQHLYNGEF